MSKNLKNQIETGTQAIAKQSQQEVDGIAKRNNEISLFEFIGATKLMSKITISFGSQMLTSLKKFQEAEGYKAYGCDTWVEFLKQHPELDMSKSKYYRLTEALDAEGAEVYDLLNSINVPLTARMQLTAGTVQIDGDEVVVADQRYALDDTRKIKRAITQIIEQMERVEAKAAKADKELEKTKKKLADAKEEARAAGMQMPDDGTDPVNQAYLGVISSLTKLGRELAELPGKEADQRMAQFKPDIQHAIELLFAFSASNAPTRRPTQQPDGLGLTQAELADLMED